MEKTAAPHAADWQQPWARHSDLLCPKLLEPGIVSIPVSECTQHYTGAGLTENDGLSTRTQLQIPGKTPFDIRYIVRGTSAWDQSLFLWSLSECDVLGLRSYWRDQSCRPYIWVKLVGQRSFQDLWPSFYNASILWISILCSVCRIRPNLRWWHTVRFNGSAVIKGVTLLLGKMLVHPI